MSDFLSDPLSTSVLHVCEQRRLWLSPVISAKISWAGSRVRAEFKRYVSGFRITRGPFYQTFCWVVLFLSNKYLLPKIYVWIALTLQYDFNLIPVIWVNTSFLFEFWRIAAYIRWMEIKFHYKPPEYWDEPHYEYIYKCLHNLDHTSIFRFDCIRVFAK